MMRRPRATPLVSLLCECSVALAVMFGSASPAQAQTQKGSARFFDGAGTPLAVAIQPDGRVIAVGSVPRSGGTDTDFAVMRFLADGTPDPSFGSAGRVTTDFAGLNDVARAVAIQPDGAIVAAGTTTTAAGAFLPNAPAAPHAIAAIARYTPAGSLDAGFGAGGKIEDQHPAWSWNLSPHNVTAVAVAPTGEILVSVGIYQSELAVYDYQLQRYGADGVQLESWGSIDASLGSLHPFAFSSAGRVVTLGKNLNPHHSLWQYYRGRLVRYTPAGSLDTTFNGTGILDSTSLLDAQAVAVQADDKIVVARWDSIVRVTEAGAVDTTYGQGGAVHSASASNNYGAVTIGAGGTIVAAGRIPEIASRPDLATDFAVLATGGSGQIILNVAIDFGGVDFADAVRIVGSDVIVAGLSTRAGRTDIAWTRLVLNPWRPLTGRAVASDWDGDGKADMIVTSSTGEWRIATSRTGFAGREAYVWGAPTDTPVVADFDGNGRMDLAVYHASDQSSWYIIDPALFQTAYRWGSAGDLPVEGDYGGDTRTDTAVFRPQTGEWLIYDPITGYSGRYQWGQLFDVPVPRDYDGDGRTDLAIYRPSTGVWAVFDLATGAVRMYQWGMPGDLAIPGDYLGTGQMQIAIYRPADGRWWIFNPATGQYFGLQWGAPGDVPVPGDYVGDCRTDLAVWRPSTGAWFVWDLGTNSWAAVGLGAPDQPPAHWVR